MITKKSPYSLNETLGRLLKIIAEHNMTIFSIIDHDGGAAQAGLEMPYTKLVIFGNPKGGTGLMLEDPDFSIELPLKIVVRQNNDNTEILYQTLTELASRYTLSKINNSIKKLDDTVVGMINELLD